MGLTGDTLRHCVWVIVQITRNKPMNQGGGFGHSELQEAGARASLQGPKCPTHAKLPRSQARKHGVGGDTTFVNRSPLGEEGDTGMS